MNIMNAVLGTKSSKTGVSPTMRILFVDDESNLLDATRRSLHHMRGEWRMEFVNSGMAALSLGCCGARAYLDVLPDSVAIFAIPGAKLEAYVGRIEALSKANAVLSGMTDKPIRWIVEDAKKYVAREARRSSTYEGIILDPPK